MNKLEKSLLLDFRKTYLKLKLVAEKSKSWENADIEKIDQQIKELDESMQLVESKFKDE